MKRAIVTGAAGFLGFNIATLLADSGDWEVIGIDNFCRGERDEPYARLGARDGVTLLELDLNEPATYRDIPLDVDVVFHMAALNGTQNFYERPFEVVRSCTLPTLYLIDHFGKATARPRFVYAGTSEAYAATVTRFNWAVPTAEDVPLCIDDPYNPRWSYGASKLHGEITTINGCRHFDMPFTIVRYHNAYGPRMGDKHVIPDFLARAKRGEYALFGGHDTRSFLFGDDAGRATIALAQADGAVGNTYHVGGVRELTMIDLARLMMEVCGFDGELVVHEAPHGSVRRRCPDVSKARALIGSFETVSLEEGLRRTGDFYLA